MHTLNLRSVMCQLYRNSKETWETLPVWAPSRICLTVPREQPLPSPDSSFPPFGIFFCSQALLRLGSRQTEVYEPQTGRQASWVRVPAVCTGSGDATLLSVSVCVLHLTRLSSYRKRPLLSLRRWDSQTEVGGSPGSGGYGNAENGVPAEPLRLSVQW